MAKDKMPKDKRAKDNSPSLSRDFENETEESRFTGLHDDVISKIHERLEENKTSDVELIFNSELSPADAADFFSKINPEDRDRYVEAYSSLLHPETFLYFEDSLQKQLLEILPPKAIAKILTELDSDDALDLLIPIDPDKQQEIIKQLSAKTRAAVQDGLSYPEESAGRLMQREVVAVPQTWTVGKTIDYLRAAAEELPTDFFDIIVITPTYHVVGEIPLSRLVRSIRKEKLENVMLDTIHTIPATMDQEDVARIFQRESLGSAPVVDEDDRLIGVITIDDIIDVVREEAEEDILKLGGVDQGDLSGAILVTTRSRFNWLLVNLFTAILASIVISFFDATIEQIVALAVLMPIVASMGGNAGTQALTVAVRALATKELSSTNAVRVIWKETVVGTLNGIAFAIIIAVITALWFQSTGLGLVIGVAMIINLIAAGFFGAFIPVMLSRAGADPALASTVFLTTITDVVGFFAFLGLAALFLL